ncbi:MAG: YceD family protein [Candidatus Gracilibacteria bacterium]
MRISIKTILGKDVGSRYEEEFTSEYSENYLEDEDSRLLSPISGNAIVLKASHAFLLEIKEIKCKLELTCSRCLKKFPYEIKDGKTSIREYYVHIPEEFKGEAAEDIFRVDMTFRALEIDEMLRQEILLMVPLAPLCKEDCKGLSDLKEERPSSPFDALGDLLK